jgi:hypothetical protein
MANSDAIANTGTLALRNSSLVRGETAATFRGQRKWM